MSRLLVFLAFLPAWAVGADVSEYFDSDGVRLHYRATGSGEPVILLHGFSGSAEGAWIKPGSYQAIADAGFRVIALDHRGHGDSEKPHDPTVYGTVMADDVARLLDHLQLRRAHVVGYSMGAKISGSFNALYPSRVISLTLGGYGWPWRSPEVTLADARESIVNRAVLPGNDLDALAAYAVRANDLVPDADTLRSNMTPVLSIVGTEDEVVARRYVEQLRDTMTHVTAVDMPGTHAGPDGALYKPQFANEIIKFLLANPRRSD